MPPIRLTLALTSMLLALPSWTVAAPVTTATGNVRVSYDVDTFSFRGGSGEDGIAETIPLPAGSALEIRSAADT